ncbi:MAG: hypothetical protein H6852_18960 [Geminicoccaceae bacterium]|jgi:hypothetical protein|nr:hypothetical protein [Geminicoccaceae bacterium]MCB9969702.1 hypothetical protein [Geminicoccaceae bacterium]HRY24417.1 hypothetical protein [Geminicoccaceae bacterium]
MTIDSGTVLEIGENLVEEIDGFEMAFPAGAYRALPVPSAALDSDQGGATNADADRYLLLPVGRERVHPISAEGLGQLVELDSVTVARAD